MKAIETKEGPIYLPDGDDHFKSYGHRLCSYQQKVYDAAQKLCHDRGQAIDIGAHVGLFTRRMQRDFDEVIAFEPEPYNFECLNANTGDKVKGYQRALSNYSGTGILRNPDPLNTGAWELADGWAVNVSKMDDFRELTHPSLIKVDTQGSELNILEGAIETIETWRPVMIIEVTLHDVRSSAIYEFMKKLGYKLGRRYNKDQIFL